MPFGITVNVLAVMVGGLLGGSLYGKIAEPVQDRLTVIFGISSICIGIPLICNAGTLAPVVLTMIVGTVIGGALSLERSVNKVFTSLYGRLIKADKSTEPQMDLFLVLLVLCCTSGTGIFGSIQEGITGDASVLLVKSILDFFTVFIFASRIGRFAAVIALPQAAVFFLLYACSKMISPLLSVYEVSFDAVGGFISLMTGLRVLKLKSVSIVDSLPSFIIIFPISWLWTEILLL